MISLSCESDIAPVVPGSRKSRRSLARKTADAIGNHISDVLENEELASRDGFLQRMEPRVKLLSLLVFAITVSLVHSIWVLGALVLATLVVAWSSRVSVASFARKVWGTAGLLAVLLAAPAMTAWITPGRTLTEIGPLALTVPGVLGAITLVLRVVASAGVALLIIWTTRWTDLLQALTALKVPDVVVATLAMTQKQIVALMRTVQQIHLARESRMLSVGSTSDNRTWVVGRMAFVVRKSVKTADDVYDAMLARGFTGAVRSVRRVTGGPLPWLWLAATIALCAVVLRLDRMVMPR
jgi:cobalt/nickel transport system permease protein